MSRYEIRLVLGTQSVVLTACVIFMEVFWCTMLNLGYAYRNSICALLRQENETKTRIFPVIRT